MPNPDLQRQMYELTGPSRAQRVVMAACIAAALALAWGLLFGGGAALVGSWFGRTWPLGNLTRRAILAVALSVYFVRLLFTQFVFLRRGISWNEAFTVAPWVLFLFIFLSIAAGTNPEPFGLAAAAGAVLFVFGSWMNSFAEYQRHVWKQRPENRGRLYTGGLFRYTRHPNYLGDLLSFSGLCLFTGRWITALVPALMLAGFVFVNVPVLDAHLAGHYGAEFDAYARRTRRLIPFVY